MSKKITLLFVALLPIYTIFSYNNLYLTLPSSQSWEPSGNFTLPSSHSIHQSNSNLNKTVDLEIIKNLHPSVLAQIYTSMSNQELFEDYHRYSNQNYLNYIRTRPGYDDLISYALRKAIYLAITSYFDPF